MRTNEPAAVGGVIHPDYRNRAYGGNDFEQKVESPKDREAAPTKRAAQTDNTKA